MGTLATMEPIGRGSTAGLATVVDVVWRPRGLEPAEPLRPAWRRLIHHRR